MRTDNDTWDISTSVGSTALFVAAARALEAQKDDPLAVDSYAEVFCRAVGGPWAGVLDGTAPGHPLRTREFGDSFVNFQGARTRYFDAYFGDAAAAGVRQIVMLAAGLDSRAFRLDWADGTIVYEVDQPQVLKFKREVLAAHGAVAKAERREVAVDLRNDWPKALQNSGFRADEPSAWLAEGLLIYLTGAAQAQLFTGIASLAAAGSHAGIEEGIPMDREAFMAKRETAKELPGHQGEWWQMIYNERHAPAAQWFSERGWSAVETALSDYLISNRRAPPDGAEERNMIDSVRL
ncbi:MAG TPA: SAM-dependent methyltransferase, partial [Mycobacterium sp.]|nr:SAM-dependent methyltransferase [Mycobacterium sp.]